MLETKKMDLEIKKYYKLSLFVNKYISVILAFILSVVLILGSANTNNFKILVYTKTDIINKEFNKDYFSKIDDFNKKSKYIKSNIFITNTYILKNAVSLGYGIFKDDKGLYFPSNIVVKNRTYKILLNSNNIVKSYIDKILSLESINNTFKLIKQNLINDNSIISTYNLYCINSFMSDKVFCQLNMKKLVYDLLDSKKKIDITKTMYNKIFTKLNLSDNKKCSILSNIYFSKYNYQKVINLLQNYCTDDVVRKISNADDLLYFSNNLFKVKSSYNSSLSYNTHLINQIYYLYNKKIFSSENIISHIKLVKFGLRNSYISSKQAGIEIYLLQNKILPNAKGNIKSDINKLIDGDDLLGIKGLKSLINNNISKSPDLLTMESLPKKIISNREKIKGIINDDYNKVFKLSSEIKSSKDNKIIYIEGFIILNYDKVKPKVPVSFKVTKIFPHTFNIVDLYINDDRILEYLGNNISSDYKNFSRLYNTLYKNLEAPLAYGDWSKKEKEKTICELVNKKISCRKNIIYLSANDFKLLGNISILLKLNKGLNVEKILVKSPLKIKQKNLLKEEYNIPVLAFVKILNKKLKGKKYYSVIKDIDNMLHNYIAKTIRKKIGLNSKQETKLIESFKIYLGAKEVSLIRKKSGSLYDIYFKKDGLLFKAIYNLDNKNISKLEILDSGNLSVKASFDNINLKITKTNSENLNGFKIDSIYYLKQRYPEEVEKLNKKK